MSQPILAIVDYGAGNLRSVQRLFQIAGANVRIEGTAKGLLASDAIILPGVGAFGPAMDRLRATGLIPTLRQRVQTEGKLLLGICLGMQLLATESFENGRHAGLDFIGGSVQSLDVAGARDWLGRKLVVPHMGWNEVKPNPGATLFAGSTNPADFYFAHTYHLVPREMQTSAATCDYGQEFVCAVERSNVFGVQFHPEKSQQAGQRVVSNFVRLCATRAAA